MKKIFTLIAMAMIAMGAMAQGNNEKTYEDNIVITVANLGEPITDRASITITEQAEEGKYTIKLNQFSFQGILLIGDVTMTDVQGDDDSEGFTNYATTQTATITNGAEIQEMLGGKIDVTVKEGSRSKGDKFYALISLTVPGVGDVEAVFGDNNFGTDGISAGTIDQNAKVAAVYTLGGQRVNSMVRGINILKLTNGKTVKVMNK